MDTSVLQTISFNLSESKGIFSDVSTLDLIQSFVKKNLFVSFFHFFYFQFFKLTHSREVLVSKPHLRFINHENSLFSLFVSKFNLIHTVQRYELFLIKHNLDTTFFKHLSRPFRVFVPVLTITCGVFSFTINLFDTRRNNTPCTVGTRYTAS